MIGMPNPALQVTMHLLALCNTCKRFHEIETPAAHLVARVGEWHEKHLGHAIEFISRKRHIPANLNDRPFVEANAAPWYLDYAANADIKLAYASSAAYTCTLTSLASSATLVAGRESTAVSNTTNLYLDYMIGMRTRVGSSGVAVGTIELRAYGSQNDTPLYPDAITGSDSNRSFTTANIKANAAPVLAIMNVGTTTADRYYYAHPVSLMFALAGTIPKNHGVWVVHNTSAALSSTAGDHILSYTGVYRTV